ncbi:hypothetical protein HK102_005337 [Quaeritorhiza haematococci]|nr:hypothetical protein HK102_005337 [Quaeritorhiza haematococci]
MFTNPIWVIKTRMCAQKASDPGAYTGLIHGLTQTWRHERFRGLYKGMTMAIVGVSHGALQFMAYEELKKWRVMMHVDEDINKLGTLEYVAMAATSKVFATVCTYPYQVIRARMQNERGLQGGQYRGVSETISRIYRDMHYICGI